MDNIRNLGVVKLVALMLVVVCSSTNAENAKTRIDQVPMYGGMDRDSFPKLKAADEKLIADTKAQFGSRFKASQAFVNSAFQYYFRDNLDFAMRRFNQAWLLDKSNPEVFWGFAVVLHDKSMNCEAKDMIDKAIDLNTPNNIGFYPDAGRIITLCAVENQSFSEEKRISLFEMSEKLFQEAEVSEPNKGYLYSTWATAYYWRGDYVRAWKMVAKSEKYDGALPKNFLNLLGSKLDRPDK